MFISILVSKVDEVKEGNNREKIVEREWRKKNRNMEDEEGEEKKNGEKMKGERSMEEKKKLDERKDGIGERRNGKEGGEDKRKKEEKEEKIDEIMKGIIGFKMMKEEFEMLKEIERKDENIGKGRWNIFKMEIEKDDCKKEKEGWEKKKGKKEMKEKESWKIEVGRNGKRRGERMEERGINSKWKEKKKSCVESIEKNVEKELREVVEGKGIDRKKGILILKEGLIEKIECGMRVEYMKEGEEKKENDRRKYKMGKESKKKMEVNKL